jgi:hypothetical protein
MRCSSIFAMSILFATSAVAQINESSSLPEIEFSQLSQRDPNPLGEKALAIHPEQWKHAETDHFIYHFVHSYVATPVSVQAAFHYRVIAKELERDQPAGDVKSHIYIFERPEEWQQFQVFGNLEPWSGGIHSAGSLFVQRNPAYKFSNNLLGHEIVHLVLHRFYADGIPCWLNEGFAQFISKDAHASYQRARGYVSKPHSDAIAPQDLIPLSVLTAATHPFSDRVHIFMMNQSVWCDFWPRLISQLFSRCSTHLRGINHSKVRCPVLTRANLQIPHRSRKNSATTPPKISELLCNKPAMNRIGIGADAKNESKNCCRKSLCRRRIG